MQGISMYMYICKNLSVCVNTHVCIYCTYVCLSVRLHVCMSACLYVCLSVCLYGVYAVYVVYVVHVVYVVCVMCVVCVCVCMHACMRACTYVAGGVLRTSRFVWEYELNKQDTEKNMENNLNFINQTPSRMVLQTRNATHKSRAAVVGAGGVTRWASPFSLTKFGASWAKFERTCGFF